MWEVKWNAYKTTVHPKVTHAVQQKIYLNIKKLTIKEIKRTSEKIIENKKPFFAFLNLYLELFKKYCLRCEQTEHGLK